MKSLIFISFPPQAGEIISRCRFRQVNFAIGDFQGFSFPSRPDAGHLWNAGIGEYLLGRFFPVDSCHPPWLSFLCRLLCVSSCGMGFICHQYSRQWFLSAVPILILPAGSCNSWYFSSSSNFISSVAIIGPWSICSATDDCHAGLRSPLEQLGLYGDGPRYLGRAKEDIEQT